MAFQNLYFIALLPPKNVSEQITALKQEIAQHYKSTRALRVMPHITLKAPFKLNNDKHSQVLEWFRDISITVPPFNIELNGFGAFDNNRSPVIYVKPIVSGELVKLQEDVIKCFEAEFPGCGISFIERNFKPHMTIAYRDLQYSMFTKAWPNYKDRNYNAEFTVNSICLLQHDGRQWNVIAEQLL